VASPFQLLLNTLSLVLTSIKAYEISIKFSILYRNFRFVCFSIEVSTTLKDNKFYNLCITITEVNSISIMIPQQKTKYQKLWKKKTRKDAIFECRYKNGQTEGFG